MIDITLLGTPLSIEQLRAMAKPTLADAIAYNARRPSPASLRCEGRLAYEAGWQWDDNPYLTPDAYPECAVGWAIGWLQEASRY